MMIYEVETVYKAIRRLASAQSMIQTIVCSLLKYYFKIVNLYLTLLRMDLHLVNLFSFVIYLLSHHVIQTELYTCSFSGQLGKAFHLAVSKARHSI